MSRFTEWLLRKINAGGPDDKTSIFDRANIAKSIVELQAYRKISDKENSSIVVKRRYGWGSYVAALDHDDLNYLSHSKGVEVEMADYRTKFWTSKMKYLWTLRSSIET